jgi:hypothetical protein
MLKQIITLIVSLIIIIFGGIFEIQYIEHSSRYLLSDIEYSKNAINNNNFELAKSHIENLEDTWNNLKGTWNIFVIQDEIDNVDNTIVTYKIHTEYGNEEEAMADCDLLKNMIEDIVQKHKVTYENIF